MTPLVTKIGNTSFKLPSKYSHKDAEIFPALVDQFYRLITNATDKQKSEIFADISYWPKELKVGLRAKGIDL